MSVGAEKYYVDFTWTTEEGVEMCIFEFSFWDYRPVTDVLR